MKTFAISIPKPCHEDWNKMTPDAKGAFCGSCQKSVYDFSDKSDEEILAVFENKGKEKVCGRFAPAQLSRPVIFFGNTNSTNRLAVFLYALLLAFGATLFSGAEAFGQNIKGEAKVKVMGKMAMRPIKPTTATANDTIIEVKQIPPTVCGIKTKIDYEVMPLGQAVVMEEPVRLTGDTIIQEIPLNIGIDTIAVTEDLPLMIDTTRVEMPLIEPEMYVAGGVSYIEIEEVTPEVIPPVVDITEAIVVPEPEILTPVEDDTEIKSTLVSEPAIIPFELDVKVSPNPSSGQITLTYALENVMPVRIDLFDITGKMVKTLSNQGKQYAGKYNVSYNISDLPNGIYIATLSTNDNKVSAKVILAK